MIQKRVIAAVTVVAAAGLVLAGCANGSGGGTATSSSSKVDVPVITTFDAPKDAVSKSPLQSLYCGTDNLQPQVNQVSAAVGVVVLSMIAAAVIWRVKPDGPV